MRVQARRALLIDSAIGFGLAITSWMASFYVWERSEFGRPERRHGPPPQMVTSIDPSPWVLPAVFLVAVGVAARRVWPRGAFIATVVGVGSYLATGSTFAPIFLAPALTVYSMAGGASIDTDLASASASRSVMAPLRSWAPLLVLLLPMIMAGYWQEPYLGLLDPAFYGGLLSVIAIAVVPAMIALLVRSRRESEREVREQERRRYAYQERLRIARDVHDVVGHSLAVITMQAGVALHLLDKERTGNERPDQVASSLEAIKKTSREALAELRTTLEIFQADSEELRNPHPGLARLEQRRRDRLRRGVDRALLALAHADAEQRRAGLGHDRAHVGEVEVDQARQRDQVGDSLHALTQHVVGDAERLDHRRLLVEHRQQTVVRDDDQRVDLVRERLDPLLGGLRAARALEAERLGDDPDGQRAELARDPRHDRRAAGAGAAALAGGDEDHVGALELGLDAVVVLHRRVAPAVGVRAGAEALREVGADLQRVVRVGLLERLRVGVDGDELDARDLGLDHPVDRVDPGAADADDAQLRRADRLGRQRVVGGGRGRRLGGRGQRSGWRRHHVLGQVGRESVAEALLRRGHARGGGRLGRRGR